MVVVEPPPEPAPAKQAAPRQKQIPIGKAKTQQAPTMMTMMIHDASALMSMVEPLQVG